MDDRELLDRYGRDGEQEAFAELVRRHSDWVYNSARRQLRDAHLAEDVTQAVFLLLARKAAQISARHDLGGWLFGTLRYCIKEALRQMVRQRREKEAAQMQQELKSDSSWEAISPVLDEAIAQLGRPDREAVLLRFYQRKPLAEVGQALGTSEEAARKRVDRAVDRLRQNLAARGVEARSLGLSALILAHAAEGGPAGLVEKITASVAQGMGSSTAGGIAQGAATTMTLIKLKAAAAAIGGILLGSATVAAVVAAIPASAPVAASTQPALTSADNRAVQDLINAMRQSQPALTGRGTATVEETSGTKHELSVVKFQLKGELARSDVYHVVDGAEKLKRSYVSAPDRFLQYSTDNNIVSVDRKGPSFRSTLGLDFRPSAFCSKGGRPVYQTIENVRKANGRVTLRTVDAHRLEITCSIVEQGGGTGSVVFTVDPLNNYAVLAWHEETVDLNGPRTKTTSRFDAHYRDTPLGFYIESARLEEFYGNIMRDAKGGLRDVTAVQEIRVTSIAGAADTSDEAFTLKGMGLPRDTLVVDKVAGMEYRLGTEAPNGSGGGIE